MGNRIDPGARFKRLRDETKQQVTADTQAQQDALKRRFAKLGLSGSGAAIKTQQQLQKQSGERLDKALGQVSSLEEQEALRRQEIAEGRDFARSEREAAQQFAAEQSEAQRGFLRGERLGSQRFASGEAALQRTFTDQQRIKGEQFQKFLDRSADDRFTRQLEQQAEQFERQFALDEEVTRFNQSLAQAEANKKDLFERAGDAFSNFDAGTVFKTGIAGTTENLFGGVTGGIVGGITGADTGSILPSIPGGGGK